MGEVVVEDVGVGGEARAGIESVGRGKNRTSPSGSWAGVIDLPKDFGVRM